MAAPSRLVLSPTFINRYLLQARRWLGRLILLALAFLVVSAHFGLARAQKALEIQDRRLGADVLVAPAGTLSSGGGILLVDTPGKRGVDADVVAAIRSHPDVAGVQPLYNLGRLSAQECPA